MTPPPILLDPEPAKSIVGSFRDFGLDAPTIRRMTEPGDTLRAPLRARREVQLSSAPEALALRLFFCAERFHPAQLPFPQLDSWVRSGVLTLENPKREGEFVFSTYHLRTVAGLYLFSDYLAPDSHPDAVMGAGETTAILYRAAKPTHSAARVLDLGCGAGALALLLARDAHFALGTDINPRAIHLARFNAAVNNIPNAEFRAGDLYQPVTGEQFDLIVSQPPYYPLGLGAGHGESHTYLHGGLRGDELPTRVLEGLPQHLTPAGTGFVFTSWPHGRQPTHHPNLRTLELQTNRRELQGARQSITVLQHADPQTAFAAAFEVPADAWGEVRRPRIHQLLDVHRLLRQPDAALLRQTYALPPGAQWFDEAGVTLLRCPPASLAGFTPLDPDTAALLRAIERRQPLTPDRIPTLRRALAKGILFICPT